MKTHIIETDETIKTMTDLLKPLGLDIVHGFNAHSYNDLIAKHLNVPKLPLFNQTDTLALLVGNTKALWEPFFDDCHTNPNIQDIANPMDNYVERMINKSLKQLNVGNKVRFGHHGGERFISLLHAAEASGFASISPANIAIHPTHGLWFGLRAVIVIDLPPPTENQNPAPFPCENCEAPCKQVMDKMLARNNHDWANCTWQERVEIRSSCPVGRDYRYSDEQIYYHYSKDRKAILPKPSDCQKG